MTVGTEELGVELVELVDGSMLARSKYTGRNSFNDISMFNDAQWDSDRFFRDVNKVIDGKSSKYVAREILIDVLLIYSAEPWLDPEDVEGWLSKQSISPRDGIKSAFLLLEYDPGYAQKHGRCWPLFKLYGELEK